MFHVFGFSFQSCVVLLVIQVNVLKRSKHSVLWKGNDSLPWTPDKKNLNQTKNPQHKPHTSNQQNNKKRKQNYLGNCIILGHFCYLVIFNLLLRGWKLFALQFDCPCLEMRLYLRDISQPHCLPVAGMSWLALATS